MIINWRKLGKWSEEFHKGHKGMPEWMVVRMMYFRMPTNIKILFLLFRLKCFWNFNIKRLLPVSWQIKILDKWFTKHTEQIKMLCLFFPITKYYVVKEICSINSLKFWWFKTFHRKKYLLLLESVAKSLVEKGIDLITKDIDKKVDELYSRKL